MTQDSRAPQNSPDPYRAAGDVSVGADLFPVIAALLAHVLEVDRRIREERST